MESISEGTCIGYADDGTPVSSAHFGGGMGSRAEAHRWCGKGGKTVRVFASDDPELKSEMNRFWRAATADLRGDA